MHTVFNTSLRLLHPFMPFLTEELWLGMNYNHTEKMIIKAKWPKPIFVNKIDLDIVNYVEGKHDLIRVGRILRSDYNLTLKQKLALLSEQIMKKFYQILSRIKSLS